MPQPETVIAASTSLSSHGWHFAAGAVFLAVGLAAAAVADARETRSRGGDAVAVTRRPRPSLPTAIVLACALATVGAAGVHIYVIPEHFEESALYGAFFVTLAVVQLGWAALVSVRPTRALLAAGLAGNLSVVLLWAATRFIAVPLGPGAGTREEIGALDVVATSFEVVVIVTAAWLLFRRANRGCEVGPSARATSDFTDAVRTDARVADRSITAG